MKTRLLLAVALVAAMLSAAAAGEPFSRARWIEREMRTRWFSGGVIPNDRMLPVPRVNPGVARGLPGLVRVSSDLLPSFGGSQPETQAEPYIAANPNNSDNLIATWQESRFADGGARCLAYATSTDGGATWSEGLPPHLTVANGGDWDRASDPWVAFGPGNRAYFISLLFNEQTPDNAVGMSVSTDGGLSWVRQFTNRDPQAFFDAMAFWDAASGIAVSDSVNGAFVMVTTTDGGRTWADVPSERLPPAQPGEGYFAASGTNVAVWGRDDVWVGTGAAARARVLHSTDRGRSWRVADTPVASGGTAGIYSVAFRDALHGVVVGGDYAKEAEARDNVARTDDGGASWALVATHGLSGFRSLVAHVPGTDSTWLAVGPTGADLSTDDGRTWSPIGGPGYHAFAFAPGRRTGWGAGAKGRVGSLRLD